MPIRYSTNWMGPILTKWYEDRGLITLKTVKFLGETVEVKAITEWYSAGRIDIRGDCYGECIHDEYSLAAMKSKDWEELSEWLDTVETDFVWDKEDLIANFERFIGRRIEWSKK